jgi:hypothetical protein
LQRNSLYLATVHLNSKFVTTAGIVLQLWHHPPKQQKSGSTTTPFHKEFPMAKKLLDQLREVLRLKHYSYRTEQAYYSVKADFSVWPDLRNTLLAGYVGL